MHAHSFYDKRPDALVAIRRARLGLAYAERPNASERFVAMANERADRAYESEPATVRECAALLAFVLDNEGELIDPAPRAALARIASRLSAIQVAQSP